MPRPEAGSFYCFPGMSGLTPIPAPIPSDTRKARGVNDPKYDNSDGHDLRAIRVEGTLRIPVLLVEFQDIKFGAWDDQGGAADLFSRMLNSDNFGDGATEGSVASYFHTVSSGRFSPEFDVFGPLTMSKREVEYVSPSEKEYYTDAQGKPVEVYPASRMVSEAVAQLSGKADLSQYDSDGDGKVDFIYIFFAGQGVGSGGSTTTTLWPHAFTLTSGLGAPVEVDGVLVDRYCISSELGSDRGLCGIGTFTHEFGHLLGFPDLYDTANNGIVSKCFTPGSFDCMDAGNYNNDARTPPMYSSYELYSLEWMKPVDIKGGASIMMLPLQARQFAYRIPTTRPTEYFLLETRGSYGYDKYLEAHGLLAWHIDFDAEAWKNNVPNNDPSHQRIDLIEADNLLTAGTRSGDLFPGRNGVCELLDYTNPALLDWNGRGVGSGISEIRRYPEGAVSFRVDATSGGEMAGMALASPQLSLAQVAPDGFTITWPAVEGAGSYMATVYPLTAFDGRNVTEFVKGYEFVDLGEAGEGEQKTLTVSGDAIKAGTRYGVVVYALSPLNASRSELAVELRTMGATFEDAVPTARLVADNPVTIGWDAVAAGDGYEVKVITGRQPVGSRQDVNDFSTGALPSGWSVSGVTVNDNPKHSLSDCSLQFSLPGDYLTIPAGDNDITRIAFWTKVQFDDPHYLDIFGIRADGTLRFVKRLEANTAGATRELELPVGCKGLRFVYTPLASGMNLYLDSVDLTLCEGYDEIPAQGAQVSIQATTATVCGLEQGKPYIAYVRGRSGQLLTAPSDDVSFVGPDNSGIGSISADSATTFRLSADGVVESGDPAISFDIYGVGGEKVAADVRGSWPLPARGIYVVTTASGSEKIIW